MKNFKNLLAIAMVCVLVMALAATAFAADVTNGTPGHTYDAYQVFKGTQSEGDPALAQIDWGTGVDGAALLVELKEDYDSFDTCNSAVDVAKILEGKPDKCAEANALAEVAYFHLTDVKTTIGAASTVELEAGYWLIVDTTNLSGQHDAKNLALLQVTNDGAIEISKKYDTPSVEKKVEDVNDSLGGEEVREDSADHDIGDSVTFVITAELGDDVESYKTYKVVFHDTLGAGFTYTDITSIVIINGNDEIDVTDDFTASHENGKLTISCDDVKALGATNNSKIVVTYTAVLNENAVIGAAGNMNTVYMEFSNDPNWDAEHAPVDPDNPDEPPKEPTGETPEDKVIVFTYQAVVNKVDKEGNPLVGAEFKLEKFVQDENGAVTISYPTKNDQGETVSTPVKGNWVEVELDAAGHVFTAMGLDDGYYRLTETKAPNGYNAIDPIEFVISAEHDEEAADPKLDSLGAEVTVGSEGLVFNFTVETGLISTNIENLPGTVLPETGGMGTTIFYIVGGLMVAAAVVLLVTKKRMAISE